MVLQHVLAGKDQSHAAFNKPVQYTIGNDLLHLLPNDIHELPVQPCPPRSYREVPEATIGERARNPQVMKEEASLV